MLAPFSNLSFSADEIATMKSALENVDLSSYANTKKQRKINNQLVLSALEKLSNYESSFSPNELRIIYSATGLFSLFLSDAEENLDLDDELAFQTVQYKTHCNSILYKVKQLLLQAGFDIGEF